MDAGIVSDAATSAVTVVTTGADDAGGLLIQLFDAIRDSNWKLAAAVGVLVLVMVTRKWGSKLVPWLSTGKGAFVSAVAMGGAGALAAGYVSGAPIGGLSGGTSLVINGVITGLTAAGLYSGGAKLIEKKPTE
jgi:hypothetical protein